MKNLIVGLIIFGLTSQAIAQTDPIKLDEVNIKGVNYKYLNEVGVSEAAEPVKVLQHKAANFDLKNAEFYEDENQLYTAYFKIPEGSILAMYDGKTSEIISTTEKFKDVRLPLPLYNALIDNYLGWKIAGDIYLVKYRKNGESRRTYKILLEKNGKYKKVKTEDDGETFK